MLFCWLWLFANGAGAGIRRRRKSHGRSTGRSLTRTKGGRPEKVKSVNSASEQRGHCPKKRCSRAGWRLCGAHGRGLCLHERTAQLTNIRAKNHMRSVILVK